MINKVILIGRLGKAPELKQTNSGSVLNISLATDHVFYKNEQKQTQTEWHRCVAFGKLAENCARYLNKGSMIYAEGRLNTTEYENQHGHKAYSTSIILSDVKFLGGGNKEEGKPQVEKPKKEITIDIEKPEDLDNFVLPF
jgi:single-strand DNA-binding protein